MDNGLCGIGGLLDWKGFLTGPEREVGGREGEDKCKDPGYRAQEDYSMTRLLSVSTQITVHRFGH